MKNIILRGLAVFFVLLFATSLMMDVLKMDFGTTSFWDKRGVFFLFFVTLFPRLTLLLSSVASGGFIWWLSLIFFPRILVASLATMAYFHSNPILVVLSWIIALGGEVFEKWGIGQNKFMIRTYRGGSNGGFSYPNDEKSYQPISDSNVIEAEFKKES